MKAKLITVLFLVFLTSIVSNSQTLWTSKYDQNGGQDSAIAIVVTNTGQVVVTGITNPTGTNVDIVTIRYNPITGDTLWTRKFGGSGNQFDLPTAITTDNNGFIYVTGYVYNVNKDMFVIKYDINTGDQVWVNTYNGSGNGGDYSFAVAVDASYNVYITGRSDVGSSRITLIKYNSSGVQQWVSVFYPVGITGISDQANAMKVDNSGNIFITGFSRSTPSTGTEDYLTLKYNSSGVEQWNRRYNGNLNADDFAVGLIIDNVGNVFVTGYSARLASNYDYATFKYNGMNGDSLAGVFYNGTGGGIDIAKGIDIDNSGNVYITGYSQGGATNADFATIKYNNSLVQQWVSRFSGPSVADFANALTVNRSTMDVYVTGAGISLTGYDYVTVRYDSFGIQQAYSRITGPGGGNDYSNCIAIDPTGNVYISGSSSWGPPTGTDIMTIKYIQTLSQVIPVSSIIPSNYNLYQNYPNPFNPATNIKIDVPIGDNVKLAVYNMLGQIVDILVDQYINPGSYLVKWDASKLPSGTYFYKLIAGDFTSTKKLVLIK